MIWEHRTIYHAVSGPYSVSRCHVQDTRRYVGWYEFQIISDCDTIEGAMRACRAHRDTLAKGDAA